MRIQVQPLASIIGLRIQHYGELWYRSQMQLRSGVSVAVVQASSYNSDLTPSLGVSICRGCSPKKQKKKERRKERKKERERNEKFQMCVSPYVMHLSMALSHIHILAQQELPLLNQPFPIHHILPCLPTAFLALITLKIFCSSVSLVTVYLSQQPHPHITL